VAVPDAESVTLVVNEKVLATVGVPEMVPAKESERPGGSDPVEMDHVYGAVPLVAVRVWL
jgi:hypothetical protein